MSDGLPYNGWAARVRHGRAKHYYRARAKGILQPASHCLGCRCSLPESCVPYHAEEYGPALEDYWASCRPLCHRCHALLHARFKTPNRWKRYFTQAAEGAIDDVEYPNRIAPLLGKYTARSDISFVQMPEGAPPYLRSLALEPYEGPPKVATLRVTDLGSGDIVGVPDWTLYGDRLEELTAEEHGILGGRQVDVNAFMSKRIRLPVNSAGRPRYKPLWY